MTTAHRLLVAFSTLMAASAAQAVTLTFTLSPAQSRLTSTATVNSSNFSAQETEVSNVSSWSGRLNVTIDSLTSPLLLQIESGVLVPLVSGNWTPGIGGAVGKADAAYGFVRIEFVNGIYTFRWLAVRGLLISMRVPETLPLTRENKNVYRFLLSGTGRPRFISQGSVDHTYPDSGTVAIRQTEEVGIDPAIGTLTFARGVARLSIPIRFEMEATIPNNLAFSMIPAGTITATTRIAAPTVKPLRRNVTTTRSAQVLKGQASGPLGVMRVDAKLGKGRFKKVAGTARWRVTARSLQIGRNVVVVRAVDRTGYASRPVKIVIRRKG